MKDQNIIVIMAALLKVAVVVERKGVWRKDPSIDKATIGGADLHGGLKRGGGRLKMQDVVPDSSKFNL